MCAAPTVPPIEVTVVVPKYFNNYLFIDLPTYLYTYL